MKDPSLLIAVHGQSVKNVCRPIVIKNTINAVPAKDWCSGCKYEFDKYCKRYEDIIKW